MLEMLKLFSFILKPSSVFKHSLFSFTDPQVCQPDKVRMKNNHIRVHKEYRLTLKSFQKT